jgi:hypothetical protein
MLAAGAPKKDIGVKLSQHAYKRFKEFLITGQIKTGTVMSQADLVRILDVPISPLREAVQVLESEGLLTVMPRSGIRIVQPTQPSRMVPASAHTELEAVSRYAISASTAEIDAWEQRHRHWRRTSTPGLTNRLSPSGRSTTASHCAGRSLRNPITMRSTADQEQLHLAGPGPRGQMTPPVKVTWPSTQDHRLRCSRMMAGAAMDERTTAMHRAMGI